MAGKTMAERIAAERGREAQAKARRTALEARARADTRRADTRSRCVLAGALVALLRAEPDVTDGLCRALLARTDGRDRSLVAALLVKSLGAAAPAIAVSISKGIRHADD